MALVKRRCGEGNSMIRLDKYLADMCLGTRSELKKEIRKGQAIVNGSVIKDPGYALSGTEDVTFKGETVLYEEMVYYMLNKPAGVITATKDASQKTVLDLVDISRKKDVFPVGRLDKDTEGLLLLTNDGGLAHRLLSPKHHVDKTYFARVSGRLVQADIDAFARGVYIMSEDYTALPAKLEILASGDDSEALVTVQEGKFHQVKNMFDALGNEVLYLKRLSMGPLVLDETLAPVEYRRLTDEETALLKELR